MLLYLSEQNAPNNHPRNFLFKTFLFLWKRQMLKYQIQNTISTTFSRKREGIFACISTNWDKFVKGVAFNSLRRLTRTATDTQTYTEAALHKCSCKKVF